MSGLTIGIDVDDVVAKLIDAWLLEYNRRSGDRLLPEDLTTWEISEHVYEDWKEKIFTLLTPAMYDVVEPYPGTQQAIRRIRKAGHSVVYITSCYTEDLFRGKVNWLERHGFGDDYGIVNAFAVGPWAMFKRKSEVPGVDWLIDDHIGNLEDFVGYRILQTRPHNRMLAWAGKRIKHLDDIVPQLETHRVELQKPAGFMDVPESVLHAHLPVKVNHKVPPGHIYVVQDEKVVGVVKDTNPKDAIGSTKVPLHFVSGITKAYAAVAHYLGNVKYGAWNYRAGGARASVYLSALGRHIDKWTEGQENDPVDNTPHLANALACINILIEAQANGNLVDDRPPSRIRELEETYAKVEGMMAAIRERYKDKDPRHYTIADTPAA